MSRAIVALDPDVLTEVESAVGERSYQRGRAYAHGGRVLSAEWDPEEELLSGAVLGQQALYDTVARFASEGWGAVEFEEGECSCPVGWDCKHVAALVIAVAEGRMPACQGLELLDEPRPCPAAPVPQAWDEPLRELIGAGGGRAAGNPLGIELSLDFGRPGVGGEPRLIARLMRTGARGGWVNGSLSWSGLDHWKMKEGDPRADHLALLHELYALHRLGQGRYSYYGYGNEQSIELGTCDSLQLWSLLDGAARIGLVLVHRRPELGEVRLLAGELVLDLTRAGDTANEDGAHVLSVRLALDDGDATQLEPVAFMGRSGHGLVCVERYSEGELGERRISLVRLGHPVPERLRRMALDGVTIAIPAGELARFGAQLYPSLRHIARVVSSDGSFEPPRISPPALVLQVHHGDGHVTEAGWGWRYLVGDEVRLAPLATDPGELDIRDPAAERQVLAAAELLDAELARWGLVDDRGRPADRPVALTGLDTMRFATEALPRLSAVEGIEVEIAGEPAAYRDVSDALTIGVATAEIPGERDWFDLGVTISVEGRELPFADVFVALASGESRLLLDDGAHFSLLEPRLQ
ncbi:MAG: SWIM zinc finger family protein, partial [Solirubrobacteraceae bacterium]